ncbi:MAG: 6-phospho-beta-glucosidase [Pseudonocardiales bacterium]|nr:6-phospho-beta-glucosidase [Pseudonocardiales bacterium]
MRAAVLGGGGFRVPLVHRALIARGLDLDEIVLQDTSPERLDVMAEVLRGDGPPIRTTVDLDTALDGVDLVFAALRVGGLDGRVRDERDALAAGVIGQETVGAGGLSSALRVVPVVDHIARRIAQLAPRAWTISMTNPAGIVTEVMSRVLGGRVIGVCDSPIALVRRACAAAGVNPGTSLAAVTGRAEVDYVGLNHLGWLRALVVDGVDRLPELIAAPDRLASFEEGRMFGSDLIASLGTIPNEYLYWYYARAEAHRALLAAGRTRGEHVRDRQREFYKRAAGADAARLWAAANDERNRSYLQELRTGDRDEDDLAVGGYETVAAALAGALTGGEPTELILNVRNGRTVSGLAIDAVIETVCRVDRAGATPLPLRNAVSAHELGLMSLVKDCERWIIQAGRTGDRRAALRAFALHPLVDSLEAARALADRALARRDAVVTAAGAENGIAD